MATRILIYNPFGIGDVVFTTPIISNLKKAMPDCFIGYICNARCSPLLTNHRLVDEVIVFDRDEWRRLWKTSKLRFFARFRLFVRKIKNLHFDLAFDLSLSRDFPLFLAVCGVKEKIGYNYKSRGGFLSKKIVIDGYHDKHIVEYYADLLRLQGMEPVQLPLQVFTEKRGDEWVRELLQEMKVTEEEFLVGIVPGGGGSWGRDAGYKHWGREKFAGIADRIVREFKARVFILGGTEEKGILREVAAKMSERATDAVVFPELERFISFIRRCNLIITNDGGPLHLAVAQGVPTVSLFGPVDDKVYGPYGDAEKHMVVAKELDCRPCYRRFKIPSCEDRKCLRSISVDEVWQTVNKVTKKLPGRRPA